MKSLLLAMTFALSSAAFASTPATVAVENFLANGEYTGLNGSEKCSVKIVTADTAVSVFITNKKNSIGFTVVDSSYDYNVNSVTGELSATQKLNAPHYLQGASKVLNIARNDDNTEVSFFISTIAMDHRGNDMSTYATCTIAR